MKPTSLPKNHAPWADFSDAMQLQARLLSEAAGLHAERSKPDFEKRANDLITKMQTVVGKMQTAGHNQLVEAWTDYVRDATERMILTADTLRKRGDIFLEHEAAGAPPVLVYDYEVVVDGAHLPRPCNYMLLHILPHQGITTHEWKRPYVIIDPRAGHGPGIGGFKPDSQVGVALKDGHPVYFVAFRPHPEPGQTLASVTHAEAAFLRAIQNRHPNAPKPIVVGNCQGGWATALLAATNPDLAGPIVLNGAPMSYWSGRLGQDPMRYNGGMLGGVLPAIVLADLGNGVFDGAHLVMNFEMLNPGRTMFRKYYDLFANIDDGDARFLEFERWWGGFFLMNEEEIRWIVESLFVGNRLGKGEARLETGRPIDLKQIRAPIIVFASHGDNITPPQQALNWIVDTYADETEIQIRGQRIIYMVHEEVGHLGIFVSSSVAKREHTQMASTVKTIEALPPGLHEMRIENVVGEGHDKQFTVSFHARKMTDILALGTGREEEPAFAAVARMSEQLAEAYETTLRPLVRSMVSEDAAAVARQLHPMRLQRSMMASNNPAMGPVRELAEKTRAERQPANADNPFVAAERLWADMVEQSLHTYADMRSAWYELTFLTLYASPWGQWFGNTHTHARTRKMPEELRNLPEVVDALNAICRGGLPEAVVRMLVLLADTRGNVRRDRLERSAQVLTQREPFVSLDPAHRARLIHEQTLIAHFEPQDGLETLKDLLPLADDRTQAMALVEYIVGSWAEMEPRTRNLIAGMREVLELEPHPEMLSQSTPEVVSQGGEQAAPDRGTTSNVVDFSNTAAE